MLLVQNYYARQNEKEYHLRFQFLHIPKQMLIALAQAPRFIWEAGDALIAADLLIWTKRTCLVYSGN